MGGNQLNLQRSAMPCVLKRCAPRLFALFVGNPVSSNLLILVLKAFPIIMSTGSSLWTCIMSKAFSSCDVLEYSCMYM